MGPTDFGPVENPHPFPLVRASRLFVLIMGVGIAIGTLREWLILPMIVFYPV
jgi:hypothetical protein